MRKFKILRLQRKENCHLSLHRQGFTLGELVIAMVVITLVVCVTLPITLSKMKKVDYTAYYMGYMAVKDMSVNILQTVLNTPLEEPAKQCLVQYADECINEPAFIPVPVSKSECEELAEIYDNIYGCYYEQDYYAGADVEGELTIQSTVDTANAGTYYVDYTVTSRTAVGKSRLVVVVR